jgi:hypothetical protein
MFRKVHATFPPLFFLMRCQKLTYYIGLSINLNSIGQGEEGMPCYPETCL